MVLSMSIRVGGFTLIELVIFIVIVGVAVAGVSLQFSQNVRNSATPLLRQKAIAIAHTYIDEMQSVRWDETTPLGGGNAATQSVVGLDGAESCSFVVLDDFDDFDCFQGVALADGFTIDIDVFNGAGAWGAIPAANYKWATISVTSASGETLTIPLYRADY